MKGCNIYFVQIFNNIGERDDNLLTNDPLLKEFQDVFVEEIPALLPNWDIYFTIDLVTVSASVSKAPYHMSTP